jgi:two-component system KDP operon response regulator KdpE
LRPAGNSMDSAVSGPRTRILALTSEAGLLRLMRSILEPGGCKVFDGSFRGAEPSASPSADIVIVDLETPDLDRVSSIRCEYPEAEIVAISRAYREADCIAILEMDVDYLPRPFRAQDLAARVRVAELRRFKATGQRRFYRRGPFVIDLFDRSVPLDGEPIALAPFPRGLLMLLVGRPGHLATFADVLSLLGRPDTASARHALCSAVFRLRRRIERDPPRPDLLLTEAGVGYRLAPETDAQSSPDARKPEREDRGDRPN